MTNKNPYTPDPDCKKCQEDGIACIEHYMANGGWNDQTTLKEDGKPVRNSTAQVSQRVTKGLPTLSALRCGLCNRRTRDQDKGQRWKHCGQG